jgi:transposase
VGMGWPLPADLDDEGLERLLYPPAAPSRAARPAPDRGYMHRELRRKGVALHCCGSSTGKRIRTGTATASSATCTGPGRSRWTW